MWCKFSLVSKSIEAAHRMNKTTFRKTLGIPHLLRVLRQDFEAIPEIRARCKTPLSDHLMSGLALFVLKYPSLLQFDQNRFCQQTQTNLKTLYGVAHIPSDTQLRARLDDVNPKDLRSAFTRLFNLLQRSKVLEKFSYSINESIQTKTTEKPQHYFLLSIDGTQFFSSSKVHCENCCEKNHRNGKTTYYHQMLSAAIVHPNQSIVFPLAPEPIQQQDGETKNDCERNAAKRLLADIRREHPHLKLIVVEDGIASNGPHINQLKSLNYNFILGAKPKDHKVLFETIETSPETAFYTWTDDKKIEHAFQYLNNTPLNATHANLNINFFKYQETHPSGKVQNFSWVTHLPLSQETLMALMRAARSRWKIENETFNTLKNQSYHFEHNFGHGHAHLANVMANLMFLGFFIDQIQFICCRKFQRALKKAKSKVQLWQQLRAAWFCFLLPDWETYYEGISEGLKPIVIPINSS